MNQFKNILILFTLFISLCFVCQPAFSMEKINLNTATIEQLMELKGVGEKTAQKIIEYRNNKKFNTVDEVVNVNGVGEKTLEKIREQLTVETQKKK
ncbi:competence protein ComEA [Desulfuromusa kysingii]|uniref:Competence protein ComEA n=1 Tax=Desulfuromusa kysingii TaxID=37625 RepID=A0A1H3YGJ5_9BACT|nr:helix-hairpin-helix domain-containing protein [Desulfuromusa kysingii]SEA10667.1 competence protein ComEA [Desulfuromusa kysingii]